MATTLKSGFLLRRFGSRIVFLFLIAAFLPVLALTVLIYGSVTEISQQQDEQKRAETSRVYAIKVLERLLFAEAAMQRLLVKEGMAWQRRDVVFGGLVLATPKGRVLARWGEAVPLVAPGVLLRASQSAVSPHKSALHVVRDAGNVRAPALLLSIRKPVPQHPDALLFAKLNPDYVWGDPETESQVFRTCLYGKENTRIACTDGTDGPQRAGEPKTRDGQWTLFLKSRFHADNWVAVTQRRYPLASDEWGRFFAIYVKVALLCVVLVALLSLIQLRRTIGPLNTLIDRTRRISRGDYAPVDLPVNNELHELSVAINDMSSQIDTQLKTLQEHEEMFRHQARFDSLTALINRRTLFAMLESLEKEASASGLTAVLLVDLDHFKFFNDTLGHRAGDLLLRQVARRLEALVGQEGVVARLSGDEFVVVLHDCVDRDAIRQQAERMIRGMGAPFAIDGNDYILTCSIGVAILPEDASGPEMIVEAADMAVFESKKKGRNNYHFFTSTMREAREDRLRLDSAVRGALDRNEFILHYQPMVAAQTGRIVAAEALLRWNCPRLGVVSPGEFIPLLEELGLMVPVGSWVLRTACQEAVRWQQPGQADRRVSVNVSAYQLAHPDFVATVERALAETGLPPHLLELELTESAIIENFAQGIDALTRLRQMGVCLAIDDFGTGYSSLYYLKQFPMHVLKIDRGFIRDMTAREDDVVIVKAMIALAHDLNLQVVAEGVENMTQRDWLVQCGCDQLQGFLFGRPMQAEAFRGLLEGQADA